MIENVSSFKKLLEPYEHDILPEGIRSRFVNNNGLSMHFLEAGYETPERSCVLLLHGFPELAYSWRHNMLPLAAQGFHVIAPDQRGYGRTTGWEQGYNANLQPFGMMNLVTDVVTLVRILGHRRVHAVVGHDYGAPVAAYASLIRPDIFRSLVIMSAPFSGVPEKALGAEGEFPASRDDSIHKALGVLNPPRKHYQQYFSTAEANLDMHDPLQGISAFFRAYYHYKSADWKLNKPHRLNDWKADELAKMPTYYIMDRDKGMAASVAPFMPIEEEVNSCGWLTERELNVYGNEYMRTGFQGALNWYRCDSSGLNAREMKLFGGRKIDVPTIYIAGISDWGTYQKPGAFEAMSQQVCNDFRGSFFVAGAGHWVQQEQAEKTNKLLINFF